MSCWWNLFFLWKHFAYVLIQRPEEHVHPTTPKVTLPRASSSSGISQQEAKVAAATLPLPCRLSLRCRGHTTVEGVARTLLIHEWQRGQNRSKKNQAALIGLYCLETQMLVVIPLSKWEKQPRKGSREIFFPLSTSTYHLKLLQVYRLVAIDFFSYWSVCLICCNAVVNPPLCFSGKQTPQRPLRSGRPTEIAHITSTVNLQQYILWAPCEIHLQQRRIQFFLQTH